MSLLGPWRGFNIRIRGLTRYKAQRTGRCLPACHALSRCVRQGGPDGTHASLQDGPPDAVQRSLSLTAVLWVAVLAWGPRDLVAANAEKAVLRTIAAQSAIFFLVNILYHRFSCFGVGSVTPRPDISDRLLACSTQEENAKTLKLFPTFDGARAIPHACQQVKVLRAPHAVPQHAS
jgi:hypothetical protein